MDWHLDRYSRLVPFGADSAIDLSPVHILRWQPADS